MKDVGHEETEKILEEIEKRISAEYAQAEKEIAEKLDDYLKKFRVKDELKLKAVENGMITKEEYEQWRVGQVMMGKRWAELRDSLAEDFTNADKIARSIAYNHMPEVYAINHDYGTFQVEKASQMDTSYTLYDRQAFEQLVKNEDTFIPAPGRKVSRDIKEGKALAWNKKQVQSVMMQGLLQGESIPKLATRLANTVGESDRKAAIRNARTMTTGVQNAGRMASYDRANKMGIKTQKQWLATLDARTRHWHASLDGEVMDNDEPFVNEFGEIMYPGDPEAAPVNIFNCRCTLIASIKGFERDVSDMDLRHDDHLEDMTYDEWREGHYDQKSDPITKQDDTAEVMRQKYGEEYAAYAKADAESKEPMKDITSEWTKKEKDGRIISQMEYTVGNTNFAVDDKFVLFEHDNKENKIAKMLSEKYGKEVRLLPRVVYPQNVQIPDYLIDGSRYDLKSPTGSGKDVLRDIIKKKKQQSHNFIYNISDCPLPLDEIERQVTQIFKAPNTKFVEQIVLANYDKVIKVYSKK